MIEIRNFSKSYPRVKVYENFDFDIEEGKVTCILGESGSGKTTLLNAVASLIKYSGSITKVRCSYVFQTPRLLPNLTVYGNLKLVCGDDNKIADMLEKAEISDKAQSYPAQLSGGQAQRVALARAFLYPSDIILMDEPFSSLDLKLKKKITELFLDIRKADGRGALFVTHDVDEAVRVADRIAVVGNGKILYDKTVDARPHSAEYAQGLRLELTEVLC